MARNALLGFALIAALGRLLVGRGRGGCPGAPRRSWPRCEPTTTASVRCRPRPRPLARPRPSPTRGPAARWPLPRRRPTAPRPTPSPGRGRGRGLDPEGAGDRSDARDVRLLRWVARSVRLAAQHWRRARRSAASSWSGCIRTFATAANSVVVLREKATAKRHKLRVGDQLGRSAGADPCRAMSCSPSAISGSNARKLSRCVSRRSRRHDRTVSHDPGRRRHPSLLLAAAPVTAAARPGGEVTARERRRRPPVGRVVINVQRRGGRARLHAQLSRPAGARRRGRPAEQRRPRRVRRREARRRPQPPLLPVPARHRPDRGRARRPQGLRGQAVRATPSGSPSAPTSRSWPGRRPTRAPTWPPRPRRRPRRPRPVRPGRATMGAAARPQRSRGSR